jgi:hypothetical protein
MGRRFFGRFLGIDRGVGEDREVPAKGWFDNDASISKIGHSDVKLPNAVNSI